MTDEQRSQMLELVERGQDLKHKLGNQSFTPIATSVMGWMNETCTALRLAAQAVREATIEECIKVVEEQKIKHAGKDAGNGYRHNQSLDAAIKVFRALASDHSNPSR